MSNLLKKELGLSNTAYLYWHGARELLLDGDSPIRREGGLHGVDRGGGGGLRLVLGGGEVASVIPVICGFAITCGGGRRWGEPHRWHPSRCGVGVV